MSDEFEGEASLLENEESVEDSGNDEVRNAGECFHNDRKKYFRLL